MREHRRKPAALLLAFVLAVLFHLFARSEEVVQRVLLVPLASHSIKAFGGAPSPPAQLRVTLSGPRILFWTLRNDSVTAVDGGAHGSSPGDFRVRVPRGIQVVHTEKLTQDSQCPAAGSAGSGESR